MDKDKPLYDSREAGASKPREKKKKFFQVMIAVVGVLIVLRVLLPYIVLNYVNKKLAEMKGYTGHVEDIDIRLYRGAYIIKDINIWKIQEKQSRNDTIPFFSCPDIDLSLEWRALFNGRIVGEIYFEKPVLNFVNSKTGDGSIKDDTADFRQLVKDLMPITVNHFDVKEGEIHYIDLYSNPTLDLYMNNVNVQAVNLSNAKKKKELLPAKITATGSVYDGAFNLDMDMDALASNPTFDMNAELLNLNLLKINPMLQAYANFDVKKGNFSVYSEFAANNGKFAGYTKPILKDLDIVQWEKEEGNLAQIAWETLVATAAEVFQNQRKEQLASKVKLRGEFQDPKIDGLRAVGYVLVNAFWEALRPAIEGSINIEDVSKENDKTFFEEIFGKEHKGE